MADADDTFVSLYRRFRPGRFSELRGQPNVVLALPGAVRDGHVSHAYLFSGPRGTGKTSTARILAMALNCATPVDGEPCGQCTSCVEIARGNSFDVRELDAASNNGVEAMRDLVAHAALGTPGRWKVYIVDEVHMLSNAAANALLKTLEEPPAHVVFVLATTDPQKVPATIRSRTQHFEFRLLGAETLSELLHDVRDQAGLEVTDEDLAAAVRRGHGSARDALSALDQVVATGSADELRPQLDELIAAVVDDDANLVLVQSAVLHDAGWGPQQLATELVDELRQRFLVALAPELAAAAGAERDAMRAQTERLGLPRLVRGIELLGKAQIDMRDAPDARVVLDVALVRLTRPELDDAPAALVDRVDRLERVVASGSHPSADSPAERMVARAAAHAAATRGAELPGSEAPPPPGTTPRRRSRSSGASDDPATPPPSAVASRPALGAFRDGAEARATGPEMAPAPASGGIATTTEPVAVGAGVESAVLAAVPSAPPEPAPTESPGPGTAPDRDSVVEAWGDHILHTLPATARALYSNGRFVDMAGGIATFALPNDAHRERCVEVQPVVEGALATHFGCPVPLRLVVDDGSTAVARTSVDTARDEQASRSDDTWIDDVEVDFDDPGEPADESAAQARLLEAFPGAEEVPG
jgi:DNA polymerase-3 subunit gamma/tau